MLYRENTHAILAVLGELHAAHAEAARCAAALQTMLQEALEGGTSLGISSRPSCDPASLTITWRERRCQFVNELRFRLFERLARRPNVYVTNYQLQQDVWQGHLRSRDTIRSTVRLLRRDLCLAGMPELAAAIRGKQQRYGLILDGQA